jgi:hypothetical protein
MNSPHVYRPLERVEHLSEKAVRHRVVVNTEVGRLAVRRHVERAKQEVIDRQQAGEVFVAGGRFAAVVLLARV